MSSLVTSLQQRLTTSLHVKGILTVATVRFAFITVPQPQHPLWVQLQREKKKIQQEMDVQVWQNSPGVSEIK